MSFLWRRYCRKIKYTEKNRPSPTLKQILFFYYAALKCVIKRISVSTFPRRHLRAGMTVEAALLLPVFFIVFLNIMSAVEMIRLHGNIQMSLWNIGNKMSVYGAALIDEDDGGSLKEMDGLAEEVGDMVFSYGYVKGQIVKYLGRDYLDESPMPHGVKDLSFLESEIFTGNDTFEILTTYEVEPWFPLKGITFRMANRYYGHIWNGYGIAGDWTDTGLKTVYIAENASVYHTSRECTHLNLTIKAVLLSGIPFERNAYGQKYTLCEKCGKGDPPLTVFIGIEGDRYHYRRDCPGLKRTIYSISLQEAMKRYRLCSRCAKQDNKQGD
mgnify:CR=1 FL=1